MTKNNRAGDGAPAGASILQQHFFSALEAELNLSG